MLSRDLFNSGGSVKAGRREGGEGRKGGWGQDVEWWRRFAQIVKLPCGGTHCLYLIELLTATL